MQIILLISKNKTREIFFWMVLLVSAALLFWLSRIGNYNNAEYGFLRCIYLFMTGAFIDVLKFRTSKFKLYIDLMLLATTISLLYFNKYNVSSSFTHLVLELGVMPLLFVCIIYRSISDDGFLTKIFSTTSPTMAREILVFNLSKSRTHTSCVSEIYFSSSPNWIALQLTST